MPSARRSVPDLFVGSIRVPSRYYAVLHHFRVSGPTMAGVSGGRTSALMHVLALAANPGSGDYHGVYANTGKEHEATLEFVKRLEDATTCPLTWIEVRKPAVYGAPPKDLRVVSVSFETASRNGEPFEAVLETMRDYRAVVKDLGPVVPSHRSRTCTAYMKIRAMHSWCLDSIGDEYDKFIGLRADEPHRVSRIAKQNRGGVYHLTPLASAGLVKSDVLEFWRSQDFDLEIPEHMGNCTMCFLKDEADIAQVAYERPEDAAWWLDIQSRFGQFRGKDRVPMEQVAKEAPVRMEIVRPTVACGEEPARPTEFDARRWKVIVQQEKRRLVEKLSFSCACEATQLDIE